MSVSSSPAVGQATRMLASSSEKPCVPQRRDQVRKAVLERAASCHRDQPDQQDQPARPVLARSRPNRVIGFDFI